jgi:ribosome-associated toxin RatA of RatAB toxin-antitoxin module
MRKVDRSALVPYSAQQMFALVEDIERYPQFVPWVVGSRIISRTDTEIVGQLEMERAGIRERFTTRNVLTASREIRLQLVAGPFKTLEGRWTFEPIAERGCKVSLSIQFEFSNPVLSLVLSSSFEKNCAQLIDAFVARARTSYG